MQPGSRVDDDWSEDPPAAADRRWSRRPTLAIPAGVALAALVIALVVAVAVAGGPSPAQSAALRGSGASGRVEIFDPSTRSARIVVHLDGLADPPAGQHYTIWVLRSGVAELTPVASLATGSDVRLDLPLPGPGRYSAVDITLQRDDAPVLHSAGSVAGAKFG